MTQAIQCFYISPFIHFNNNLNFLSFSFPKKVDRLKVKNKPITQKNNKITAPFLFVLHPLKLTDLNPSRFDFREMTTKKKLRDKLMNELPES